MADYYSLMLQQRSQRRAQMMSLLMAVLQKRWADERMQQQHEWAVEAEERRTEVQVGLRNKELYLQTIAHLNDLSKLASTNPELIGQVTAGLNELMSSLHDESGNPLPWHAVKPENFISPTVVATLSQSFVRQKRNPETGEVSWFPMSPEEASQVMRDYYATQDPTQVSLTDFILAHGWSMPTGDVMTGLLARGGTSTSTSTSEQSGKEPGEGTPTAPSIPTASPQELLLNDERHKQAVIAEAKNAGYPLPGELVKNAPNAAAVVQSALATIAQTSTTTPLSAGHTALGQLYVKRAEGLQQQLQELQAQLESFVDPETGKLKTGTTDKYQETMREYRVIQHELDRLNTALQTVDDINLLRTNKPEYARRVGQVVLNELESFATALEFYADRGVLDAFPGLPKIRAQIDELKSLVADPNAVARANVARDVLAHDESTTDRYQVVDSHTLDVAETFYRPLRRTLDDAAFERLRRGPRTAAFVSRFGSAADLRAALPELTDAQLKLLMNALLGTSERPEPATTVHPGNLMSATEALDMTD